MALPKNAMFDTLFANSVSNLFNRLIKRQPRQLMIQKMGS